jgi:eukaryotic-like serine/threonine-protein kinase
VQGMTFDNAQAKLNGAGFVHVVTSANPVITTDKSKDNKVVNQNPTGGHAYNPSVTVTLTLYQYQAPSTSCVTTPNPPSSGSSNPSGPPSGPGTSPPGAPATDSSSSKPPNC